MAEEIQVEVPVDKLLLLTSCCEFAGRRHRISCHRCGNIRKRVTKCDTCPHVYCRRCVLKANEQHGRDVFKSGCPVCKLICCCNLRDRKSNSIDCANTHHCYRKCTSSVYQRLDTNRVAKVDSIELVSARPQSSKRKKKALEANDTEASSENDSDESAPVISRYDMFMNALGDAGEAATDETYQERDIYEANLLLSVFSKGTTLAATSIST